MTGLFRAIRKDNGAWAFGSLLRKQKGKDESTYYIVENEIIENCEEVRHLVNENTICQATDIPIAFTQDRVGMYELEKDVVFIGDVLKKEDEIGIVENINFRIQIAVVDPDDPTSKWYEDADPWVYGVNLNVIGTVFEMENMFS